MSPNLTKITAISLSTALCMTVSSVAKAITFNFDWMGQISGFRVEGQFSYDETQSYVDGIVRTSDLDDLTVSFFGPDGTLLETYSDNHLDPGVNFNFDTNSQEILQMGSYNEPDGLNLGAMNFDIESGNDPALAEGLSFWSKPPRSSTPHLHVDDWADEFGFPVGFAPHEDVAFPTRTTQELVDTGRVGIVPVTALGETGQFAQVTIVPEPGSLLGVFTLSFLGLGSIFKGKSVKN